MRPSSFKQSHIGKDGNEKVKGIVSRFNQQRMAWGKLSDQDEAAARNIAMLGAFEETGYKRPAVF
ncbi:hypothetical protein FBU59_003626 [Linderina macrospora]|uniref:Uncharacterized protein n=1 Tax=Linderina macrospora TaxID=4868 RepID=A0ACC1J7Z8_9FUNG|nr:hypothetical protein FBU59_003626 [Linderina macrospora]